MADYPNQGKHIIVISFILAFMAAVFPLSGWLAWARPDFILLVLIFWVLALPYRLNVGVAFVVGLLTDLLNGSVFGENALAYVIISYIVAKYYRHMPISHLFSHAVMMLVILLTYKVIIFLIEALFHQAPTTVLYWLSLLTNFLVWPLVYLFLMKIYRYFHIE